MMKQIKQPDRKKQPAIRSVEQVKLVKPEKNILDNGIPLITINVGTQEIARIDFIVEAGQWYENKPLIALTVNKMLTEGTENYSSGEIAEIFDYYGAYIDTSASPDNAYLTVFVLNRYLDKILPVVADIIHNPVFPPSELSVFLQNRRQRFIINQRKVKHIARRRFPSLIFGPGHPYGKLIGVEDYENIGRQELVAFHNRNYVPGRISISVCGKIPQKATALFNKYFGNIAIEKEMGRIGFSTSIRGDEEKKHLILKPDALQSAVKVGRVMFNKKHQDYYKMQFVITLLGGYFGSRLMANLREDKGFTYGVGAYLISLQNSGYLQISTEVGKDYTARAIEEVHYEIDRLKSSAVSDRELKLVRNYMLGSMMRSLDGPFALAESYRQLVEYGLNYRFFERYIREIKNTSPQDIMNLSMKYLNTEGLTELVVGP